MNDGFGKDIFEGVTGT